MADVTSQQLAQLLLGIARAQNAIVEALENSKVGFKATHFRPAVESASRIRANRTNTLADYPSRLLLQFLGRTGPDIDAVTRDLETLLAAPPPAAPAAPAASTYASAPASAPAPVPESGDDDLDMTR